MAETVGTIGTTYENRKSKKLGVLESREEKFKTLMMRDNEGKSFNITYSNFKSNWRKYQGEDVIKTSSQTTEEKQAVTQKAEAAKSEVTDTSSNVKSSKSSKDLFDKSAKSSIASNYADIVKKLLQDAGISLDVMTNAKHGILVKDGRSSVFEIWPLYNTNPVSELRVRMKKDVWDEVVFSKKVGNVEADFIERDKMQFRAKVSADVFEEAFGCTLNAYKTVLEATKKEDK